MEAFLPDRVKIALLGVLAAVFVLSWLSRRMPQVRWLRLFRWPVIEYSDAEKARRRRSGNRMAAVEMILAGLLLPLLYIASTVMMFNDFGTVATLVVAACSVSCIALGIWMLAKNL